VVGENLVAPSVPIEVGKTRALVQVLHRPMKPGQKPQVHHDLENQNGPYEDWQGVSHREASLLIALVGLCNILVLTGSLHRIDHPRCVSAKNACIFYRTLTSGVTGAVTPDVHQAEQSGA